MITNKEHKEYIQIENNTKRRWNDDKKEWRMKKIEGTKEKSLRGEWVQLV